MKEFEEKFIIPIISLAIMIVLKKFNLKLMQWVQTFVSLLNDLILEGEKICDQLHLSNRNSNSWRSF